MTLRLQNGSKSASVAQIEANYGQINVLVGIEFETAKRKKRKKDEPTDAAIKVKDLPKQPIELDEIVPAGAVDLTHGDYGADE